MKRTLLAACLCAGFVAAFSTPTAQAGVHVDFLFGGGGYYHHHHHHPHYRYWADYYWYAPPPAVRYVPIAPAPVVYVPTAAAPVVAQPVAAAPAAVPTTAMQAPTLAPSSQTAATPNLPGNPVPSRTTTREASNTARSTVSIANPTSSGGQVSFIVDGDREITLAPGETKTLDDAQEYVVEFDRGEAYGTTRIVLADGSYEFAVTSSGWDLQRRSSVALKPGVRRNALPTVQR